ncbi:MAG: type-4 uracil-DNA glycosylase [Candidatus Aenigmatarchaeota archaeon]
MNEEELKKISEEIKNCNKCPLYKSRKNAVPGEGDFKSGIMLIGEAPGFNEDLQGRPFVGRAGKLLEEFLKSVGKRREEVFITNVVKCRPPNNRQPEENEIKICTSLYLDRQIEIIKPKLIVCLGNISASYIFKKFGLRFESMNKQHGKVFSISNLYIKTKIVATYHPAAILRNPNLMNLAKADWEIIKEEMEKL